MCIQNKMISLVFKIVLLAVSALAFVTALATAGGGFSSANFLYYTTLVSGLATVYFLIAAITIGVDMGRRGIHGYKTAGPHFRGGVTMALLLGLLVYNYTVPGSPLAQGPALPLVLAHFVLPVLALVDWLLFDYKGKYRAVDPLWWLVFPYVYYLITLLVAQYGAVYQDGSTYPYLLINPDIIGWAPVLTNMVLLTGLYLLFGYILFAVDRILGVIAKKGEERKRRQELGPDGYDFEGKPAQGGQQVYRAGQADAPAPPAPPEEPPTIA